MAEEENSWVFDSLVCFLKGPIWDAPIQNFIEEKSLIFEPNNVENEDDYHKIFDEYKNLVDFMLGNFMEDIGITPAQFEYACFKSRQHHHSLRFDQSTFEQIWAANNYNMFKRMMTQRNVELQLQALELIEKKYGILPQSFVPSKKETDVHIESLPQETPSISGKTKDIEKVILNEVAKKFVEEEPSEAPEIKSLLEEKEILESTRDKISSEHPETDDVEAVVTQKEEIALSETTQIKKAELQDANKETRVEKIKEQDVAISAQKNLVQPEKYEIKSSSVKQIDQLELKKRQEYLRKQRDKLVALKKEERKKQFGNADNENVMKKTRPKSAKAAEAVLTGEQAFIPSQQLQLRKALAERLKMEVVDKNRK